MDSDLYVPCDNNNEPIDLNIDRQMIWQLANLVKEKLQKYLQQPQTLNQLTDKQLSFVILERHGPNKKKTNYDPQSMEKFVRFGFHIYFNNIKLSGDDKKILATLLKEAIEPFYKEQATNRYKTTEYKDFFDTQPFFGTTSLPLTWNDDTKRYSYMVEDGQQTQMHDLDRLDPFNGDLVYINSMYLKNFKQTSLVSFLNQKQPFTYQQSLLFVYNELQSRKINTQLMNIILEFQHIQWQNRENFIECVYQYLGRNEYLTQLAYYIAMSDCMIDIIEQSTHLKSEYERQLLEEHEAKNVLQWMNSTQDRYPYKCVNLVEKVVKQSSNRKEQCYLIKRLIRCYNKNLADQQAEGINLDKQEMDDTNGIYDEFTTWKNTKWRGNLKVIDFEDMREKQFKGIFMKYIYIKLLETLKCYRETEKDVPEMYEFQVQEHKDQYHYKYIDKISFTSKLNNYYDEFLDDYNEVQAKNLRLKQNATDINENDPQKKKSNAIKVANFTLDTNAINMLGSKNQYFDSILSYLQIQYCMSPNQEDYFFGVYNGVLQYDKVLNKFKLLQDDAAREHFITRSTMFNVPSWLVDEYGYLIDIDKFAESQDAEIQRIYNAYKEIKQVYDDIFMENIEVFQWKIYEIVSRLIWKNKTTKCIFVTKCTGSGGKSLSALPLLVWIGQKEADIYDQTKQQKRKISQGYSGQPMSSILQTENNNAGQHSTGGYAELYGAAYCMLSELSGAPIVNAQVKTLCEDTPIQCREIFSPNVRTFTNKAFMELQTNDKLVFKEAYDYGTQRRIYPFTFTKKFVDKETYDASTDPNKEHNFGIKREGISEKFCTDFDYIDAGNIYMLKTFLEWKHRAEPNYIPEIVRKEQKQLFNEYYPYIEPFNAECIEKDQDSYIPYDEYMYCLKEFVKEHEPEMKGYALAKTMVNYDYLVKEYYINDLVFIPNDENQEMEYININKFDKYIPRKGQGIIAIKGIKGKKVAAQ